MIAFSKKKHGNTMLLASILGAFTHTCSILVRHQMLHDFLKTTLSTCDWKRLPKLSQEVFARSINKHTLSCTLVSLTLVRRKSVISKMFLISKFPARFSCTLANLAQVKQVCGDQKKYVYRRKTLNSESPEALFWSKFGWICSSFSSVWYPFGYL